MKANITILAIIFIATSSIFSQPFIGPKYTKTTTWLFSKYVSDKGDEQDYGITGGQNYGFYGGMDFNENIGIQVDLLLNSHSQNYTGKVLSTEYNSRVDLKSFDIPVMIKLGNPVYFEMGPVFSFINKAEYTFEGNALIEPLFPDESKKDDFKSSNTQLAFGFGGDITIADNLFINMGLRVCAGVTDLGGVDAFGLNKDFLEISDSQNASNLKTYSLSGGIHIGVKYKFE